jgi:hypothetical protein
MKLLAYKRMWLSEYVIIKTITGLSAVKDVAYSAIL